LRVAQPDENVLVVPRSLFDELGAFHGLNFEPEKYLRALLSRGNNFFLPRAQAETDPSHKQIIPYALIAHGDTVLHYVRGKKAGEQRLVAKGSIGIGGHMNDPEPKVQKREAMITNLSFLNREQLLAVRDNLETWSQLCVDSLGRLLS